MKKVAGKCRVAFVVFFALVILAVFPVFGVAAEEQTDRDSTLRFGKDGKFTVMQIADVQDYGKTNQDAIRVIEAALDKVQPDLVVFTGDQVEGYATYFKYGDKEKKVKQTIDNFLAPLDERGVPFAVVFGNHDQEAGVSKEQQMQYYQAHPTCLAVDEGDAAFGCGTYNLPVTDSSGEKTVFNFYFVDSNSSAQGGGYDNVHADQIALCKKLSDGLKAENGGMPIPSLLFQHIPVEELYYVLKEVPADTPNAKKWYRDLKPGFFVIDESNMVGGKTENFFFREAIASPDINSGQFDSWLEQGDIIGAYFGHDHINNFVGNYQGIDLGYGLGTSYNAYGAGKQGGVRVFELDERNPTVYETYGLQYQELCGDKMLDPIASFCSTKLSFPATELAFYAVVAIPVLAVFVTVSVLLMNKRKKKRFNQDLNQVKTPVTK